MSVTYITQGWERVAENNLYIFSICINLWVLLLWGGAKLLDDFKMIIHKLSDDLEYINIYPVADVHIGSQQFNEKAVLNLIEIIRTDENAYIMLAGDLLNNGVKSSKTNCYEETMRPSEQKEYLYKALLPIKHKILACCGGNHCYRNGKEVDNDPLYDVMARLQIEHLYRQNGCFVKINLGQRKDKQRQISYSGVLTHGASKNKHDKFCMSIDGADFFISGHTHTPEYTPKGKLRIDTKNEVISQVAYKQIVCHSFLNYGGYGLRAEYTTPAPLDFPKLKLMGKYKRMLYQE